MLEEDITVSYLEMAEKYLQAIQPRDDSISEELRLALCLYAGEAGKKNDWDTYDRVMSRLPVDLGCFLELLDIYSKEELVEIFNDMNMCEVIKVFGEKYLDFEWPSDGQPAQ